MVSRSGALAIAITASLGACGVACNVDFAHEPIGERSVADGSGDGDQSDAADAATTTDADTGTDTADVEVTGDSASCDCPIGEDCCGASALCVSLLDSPTHCGACGVVCDSGLCIQGVCCAPNLSCAGRQCGGFADDGCGFPLDCGRCPDGELCDATGQCVDPLVWEPRVPDNETTFCISTLTSGCPDPGEPFYGQDGNFVINPPSYEVAPDGATVEDSITGLVWQRDALPPADAAAQATACATSTVGGFADWRLPEFWELYTIVDHGRETDSYSHGAFSGLPVSTLYITATPASGGSAAIDLDGARVFPTDGGLALCVRGNALPLARQPTAETVIVEGVGLEFSTEVFSARRWRSALSACVAASIGGHEDWRLPTAHDLALIYSDLAGGQGGVVWPEFSTPVGSDLLWSSTPDALESGRFGMRVRAFTTDQVDTTPIDVVETHPFVCVRSL